MLPRSEKKYKSGLPYRNARQHYEECLGEVLKLIPDKSVIVLDQASYHKRITEETKNPTTAFRKQEIIDWLTAHDIPLPNGFSEFSKMTVPMLLALARQNKMTPLYVVEKMARDSGKDVKLLWLPVAHCELNAIELIWSTVKSKFEILTPPIYTIVLLSYVFCAHNIILRMHSA